jgi:hypothetical protein
MVERVAIILSPPGSRAGEALCADEPVHQTGSSENRFFRLFVLLRAAHGASPPARRYAFDLISLCPDLLVQTISGVIPLYFSSDLTS